MMKRFLATAGVTLALCATTNRALAQKTWIVDKANGPGAHFTTLPSALTTAGVDDLILVRPGNYKGGDRMRGVRLVFDVGANVTGGALGVRQLPRGENVSIAGFNGSSLVLNGNAGSVVVDCAATMNIGYFTFVQLHDCASVVLMGLSRNAWIDIARSNVSLSRSNFGVAYGFSVTNATLFLADCRLRGANGAGGRPVLFPQPAISVQNSRVMIAASCDIAAGQHAPGYTSGPVPAISVSTVADLQIDPGAVVRGTQGPPISGATANLRTVPGLSATSAMLGGNVTTTLTAPLGSPVILVASLPATPTVAWFGDLFLDPLTAVTINSGTVGTGGVWGSSVAVPASPLIRGSTFHLQGAAVLPGGLFLTTPAAVIVQ